MKKTMLALLLVILCGLPLWVQAEKCPNHPNAKTKTYPYGSYERHSSSKHRRLADEYCSVCGKYLGTTYVFEKHSFNSNDVCRKCGYEKQGRDELTAEAIINGEDAIGRELRIIHAGKMYSRPNGSVMYSVDINEQYYVLDFQEDRNTVWLQVGKPSDQRPIGWIMAEIASINTGGIRDVEQENDLSWAIGRSFKINVSSGRGRTGPGQEFAYVETVRYGQTYTIKDAAYASNGMVWYMLKVSGTDCWVSSGLGSLD